MAVILPPELLIPIFKYIKDDYKTLYSCILVNKQWHNINIPNLWRNPFYSKDSVKILINCLLAEDKDILVNNDIQLNFKLLEKKPPIYNYAKFATELDFKGTYDLTRMVTLNSCSECYRCYRLKEKLVNFILDYSTIRKLDTIYSGCNQLISHHRFNACFQHLYKLNCEYCNSCEFFDKLSNVCRNIQVLKINIKNAGLLNDLHDYESRLVHLIKVQNQIKQLFIDSDNYENISFSDDFKESILKHSKSIVHYKNNGSNNIDSLIIPKLQNLKVLLLKSYIENSTIKNIKSILFPNIETVYLNFVKQPFLLDVSEFIKINGNNLKSLTIIGDPNDENVLELLIQTIAENCQDLKKLTILYKNKLDKQLTKVFVNCIRLEYIKFYSSRWDYIMDGDRILSALNQTLPKNLNTLHFGNLITILSNNSLDVFMKNRKESKLFTIVLSEHNEYLENLKKNRLVKKYEDLGFLHIRFEDKI